MTEQALPENGYFRLGDYYVDVGDNRVFHKEESRHLEPKAMHVLYQLALSAGETVSRQDLMDKVWQGRVVIEDALTRIISQLRVTFDDNKSRRLIQTVPKKGYRLTSDVSWLTRQEFLARSSEVTVSLEPASASQKYKWFAIAALSTAFVAIGVFLLLPVLFHDPLESASTAVSNESLVAQQKDTNKVASTDTSSDISSDTSSDITLAFLPWRNLTGDKTNDYLAEMLPEELSITLAKSHKISVLARYANVTSASQAPALESFVDELALDYWVEGSITEANEQIRVLVRLVEKSSTAAVWSEVYADDIEQVLRVNARIIADIQTQLFGDDPQGMSSPPAGDIDIEAYRAYLQGNYWWMNGKTSEWYRRAESSFLQATEIAPNFAAAYGSLAFIYARYNYHDVYMDKALAVEKAKSAIDSALSIDATTINALLAGALLAIEDLDFEQAEQLLNKVLALEPGSSRGLYVYSELALAKNQLNEALNYASKALKADPLSPWINVNLAIVHFWRNEMPKALAAVEQSIKIDNNYTWAYVWKAKILKQTGRLPEAIEAMTAVLAIDDGSPVNSIYLAMLHQDANNLEQAELWFAHTASLYGDSPEARFWQSYLSFSQQEGDPSIARQLLAQLTIKSTRFFSVEPLEKGLLASEPMMMEAALVNYLSSLQRPVQGGFWVNYQNQYRAYIALAYMQRLNTDEYAQELKELRSALAIFENAVAPQLRAQID